MLIYPPSKINIGLYVTDKRDDGYHNICSLFYPLGLCDILEFIPCEKKGGDKDHLTVTGLGIPGNESDNLLLKTCAAVREKSPLPFFKMHLHKQIPAGAGLGGGSSDAAGLLRELGKTTQPGLSIEKLKDLALQLGSDCPFFLNPAPSLARGRGEILEEYKLDLSGYWLSLFNPGIHVSTANTYQLVDIGEPEYPPGEILKEDPANWKDRLINVFEKPVFRMFPEISEIKESLYKTGALYASMTGSGSSVFGIFSRRINFGGKLGKYHIWTEKL